MSVRRARVCGIWTKDAEKGGWSLVWGKKRWAILREYEEFLES
jgi:hypothetical protein